MIGWVVDKLRELVLEPQTTSTGTVDLGERYGVDDTQPPRLMSLATVIDDADIGEALDVQGITIVSATTRPVSYEIGGSMELEHVIGVALAVTHADLESAGKIRDAIATELVLRLIDSESDWRQSSDPVTGQYVSRLSWSIDYRPVAQLDAPSEWARLAITVSTTLDR